MLKVFILVTSAFFGFLLFDGLGLLCGFLLSATSLVAWTSNSESDDLPYDSINSRNIDFDDNHHAINFSDTHFENGNEVYKETDTVNPATGLPMIGDIGGVDIGGNPFGANLNEYSTSIIDDTFTGSGFDDSIESGFDNNDL